MILRRFAVVFVSLDLSKCQFSSWKGAFIVSFCHGQSPFLPVGTQVLLADTSLVGFWSGQCPGASLEVVILSNSQDQPQNQQTWHIRKDV